MQIEVIPGAHHSPGVRCLDSAREALIGHRGQSSEVGEPTVTFCSTGPCREGLGHGFSHLYAERKMNLHFTRKSCYLHIFFSGTQRTWNIKPARFEIPRNIENDKGYRYGLLSIGMVKLSSLNVQQFVFTALPKSWQGLWTVEGWVIL